MLPTLEELLLSILWFFLTVQNLIVDYCVWSALERNVYRRRFENTIELKEAILQKWEAFPQAVINNAIDGFRSRVRLVIAENEQHIEK